MLSTLRLFSQRRVASTDTYDLLRPSSLILLLVGTMVLMPTGLRAQPQLVQDQFSASVADPGNLAHVGAPFGLCFHGDVNRRLDGNEMVLCYDGSQLRQVSGAVRAGFYPNFTRYDGALYFGGFGPDGLELYRFDGSTVNQVADINPTGDAEPLELTVYDDGGASGADLYFTATNGTDGRELWRHTSGEGVTLVEDINGSGDGIPQDVNNRLLRVYDDGGSSGPDLYFRATNGSDGTELWRYESGSSAAPVTEINPSGDADPRDFVRWDDGGSSGTDLYFSAEDGSNGGELWRYESEGSASRLTDITGSAFPYKLTVYDDGGSSGADLYFQAAYPLMRYEPASGASRIDLGDVSPSGEFTVYDDGGSSGADLYFSAVDGTDGKELWRYDSGSVATQITDINPGGDNSSPQFLTVYDGTLYFGAKEDALSRELWSYDGTVSKVRFSNNLEGGPDEKVAFDGALYFEADDRRDGRSDGSELWRYAPGTGISEVADINPSGGSRPGDFTRYNDGTGSGTDLYFRATDGNGNELWRYTPGSGATRLTDINTSSGSEVRYLTVYDDGTSSGADLYFRANDFSSGRELWRYDSGSGAVQVADIHPNDDSFPRDLVVYDDGGGSGPDLYFSAAGGTDGGELWRYESGASPAQVVDVNTGAGDSAPSGLTVFDDGGGSGADLYFTAFAENRDARLWRYESGSGVTEVADIGTSANDVQPETLVPYQGALYFTANNGSSGRELFVYEPRTGLRLVKDINPSGSAAPSVLTVFDGRLYFTATNGADGREPYVYDGSTINSLDFNAGGPSGGGFSPALFDDGSGPGLYITATDGQSGLELYRISQGTKLPVELASFNAAQSGASSVDLSWTTASETNNAGFRVEHQGPAASSWSKLGFVEGNGTTTNAQSYRFDAEDLSVGTHRFRLKQVDLDGSTSLRDPVTVDLRMGKALRLGAPSPNPVQGTARVSFAVKEAVQTQVTLYNVLGQQVTTLYRGTPTAGEAQSVRIRTSDLASGVYFLRLQTDGQTRTERLTVVR